MRLANKDVEVFDALVPPLQILMDRCTSELRAVLEPELYWVFGNMIRAIGCTIFPNVMMVSPVFSRNSKQMLA